MAFEQGSISLRMYYLSGPLPDNVIEQFRKHAIPPLDTLGSTEINGWATGRHLLDWNITKESAFVSGYLRLDLVKAEKKIPSAIFRAECRMEELARMAADGVGRLKRVAKMEIKKAVTERMLPSAQPTLSASSIVLDPDKQILYSSAISDKQSDALVISFRETTGVNLISTTPEATAYRMRGINVRDTRRTSFSPSMDDNMVTGDGIGQDFLTWLWFYSEAKGGILSIENVGQVGVAIDGPLVFVMEGSGAHETLLRRGTPQISVEAKASLLAGKKLRSARILFARGEETWTFTIDADRFVFRGLRIPKGEAFGLEGQFQERMMSIEQFRNIFAAFFGRFLSERFTDLWPDVQKEIHTWVSTHAERR